MNTLPPELVLDIFDVMSFMCPQDRWALVATCRGFYNILNPHLYRHVKLRRTQWTIKNRFEQFFKTILNNNHLASQVREISFFGPKPESIRVESSGEDWSNNWGSDEWLITARQETEIMLLPVGRRRVYIRKWETNAMVAMLVLRLKNLQGLNLGYEFWSDYQYLIRIFKKRKAPRDLRRVFFDATPLSFRPDEVFDIHVDTELLRQFLEFPCMEHISCPAREDRSAVDDSEISPAFEPLENPCNNLRYLRVARSSLRPSTITKILAASPRLRHFEYQVVMEFDSSGRVIPVDCEELDTVLKPMQDTLTALALGIFCAKDDEFIPDIRGYIRSLPDFTQLTYLKIYHKFLLQPGYGDDGEFINLLPRTLQVLRVLGMNSYCYDNFGNQLVDYELLYYRLEQYVNKKATHAPELGYLDVICGCKYHEYPPWLPGFLPAHDRLLKACMRNSIMFNTNQIWQS